jgi:hypothetical protein
MLFELIFLAMIEDGRKEVVAAIFLRKADPGYAMHLDSLQ